jgi:hypothetical protein
MIFVVVDKLKKVIAWSNKCGGSSVRKQILIDLQDESIFETMNSRGVTAWEMVHEMFPVNQIPSHSIQDYTFEWYVRDPYYRLLSCFINRKILIEKDDRDLTFKDFVFDLDVYRQKSNNIRGHTSPQVKNYFDAPWNIIDINLAKFSFQQKMNSTRYTLGDKDKAWMIPSKDLIIDGCTYSETSFYSGEIIDKIREIYLDDYRILSDKIKLV